MQQKYWLWIAILCGVSLGVTFFAPISEVFRGVASLPAVAGISGALFQLIRDHSAHQRQLELQSEQQLFNLGATSHMANTVFDKHVEFCEKYLAEVHRLVITLTREGPTEDALQHAGELYDLRIEYTAWITPEIEDKLLPFEQATRRIGANAGLVTALSSEHSPTETRSKAIDEMYDIFSSIMDFPKAEVKDEDATVAAVKNRVREILQVNELVAIREHLIHKAASISEAANKRVYPTHKS